MSIKNITVDDILEEIKQKSQEERRPVTSMDQVDAIIRDILEKRQEHELGRVKRELSLKEKKQFDDEIQSHVKVLTNQFEQMLPEIEKTLTTELPNVSNDDMGVRLQHIHKEQKVHLHETAPLVTPNKAQRAEQLKKTIHTAQLRKDMKEITGHFEGKMSETEHERQEAYNKMSISQNGYKELRSARNKKVDSFVLTPQAKPDTTKSVGDKAGESGESGEVKNLENLEKQDKPGKEEKSAIREQKREEKRHAPPAEYAFMEAESLSGILPYEYTSRAQKEEVRNNLTSTLKSVTLSLVLTGILSLVSLLLLFAVGNGNGIEGAVFNILGFVNLTPRMFAIVNTGFLLAACGCGFSIFSSAFHSMAEHKPDKDVFYMLIMVISTAISVVFCFTPESLLISGVNIYAPLVVLGVFFNYLGKRIAVNKVITEFDYISENDELYSTTYVTDNKSAAAMLVGIDDLEGQVLVKNVQTGFFQNFLAHAFSADMSDRVSSKLPVLVLAFAVLAFAAGFFFTKNLFVGISAASGILATAISFILPLISVLPIKDAADVVRHFAGYMPDHEQISTFADAEAVMLDATALFSHESVLLHGIKTFQGNRIDDAIVDAASILVAANSVLKAVFLSIIADKRELLKPVDSIIYEDSMGISGWVSEKRVLIGNRELMIQHSIPVPKAEYEMKYIDSGQEMVYLSSEGVLCAAFVLQFTAAGEGADLFTLLNKNGMATVIKTVDSCITLPLLARVFDIDTTAVRILPSRLHRSFDLEHMPLEMVDLAIANNGNSFGYAVQLAVCKKLMPCIKLGATLYWVGLAVTMLLLIAAPFLKIAALAGGLQLILVMLLFLVAYWIYEKNIRL